MSGEERCLAGPACPRVQHEDACRPACGFAPASPPADTASTGADVEALARVLRQHNDAPDGNNRYTSSLQDALFNVWAEADDSVGDYEIGERLAEAAIKSITDTASDWLAAHDAATAERVRRETAEGIAAAIEAAADHGSRVGFGVKGCFKAMIDAARIAREQAR